MPDVFKVILEFIELGDEVDSDDDNDGDGRGGDRVDRVDRVRRKHSVDSNAAIAMGTREREIFVALFTAALSIILELDNVQMSHYLKTVFNAENQPTSFSSKEAFMAAVLRACAAVVGSGDRDAAFVFLIYPVQWHLLNRAATLAVAKVVEWFAPTMLSSTTGRAHPSDAISSNASTSWDFGSSHNVPDVV